MKNHVVSLAHGTVRKVVCGAYIGMTRQEAIK